eukprot:1125614-Rhodomonas_salina.5
MHSTDIAQSTARAGVPCLNPYLNPLLATLPPVQPESTTADPPVLVPDDSARGWEGSRTSWCTFSMGMHYAVLAWGCVFVVELVIRYLGHQGFVRYFTVTKHAEGKKPKPATGHVGKVRHGLC